MFVSFNKFLTFDLCKEIENNKPRFNQIHLSTWFVLLFVLWFQNYESYVIKLTNEKFLASVLEL